MPSADKSVDEPTGGTEAGSSTGVTEVGGMK